MTQAGKTDEGKALRARATGAMPRFLGFMAAMAKLAEDTPQAGARLDAMRSRGDRARRFSNGKG